MIVIKEIEIEKTCFRVFLAKISEVLRKKLRQKE